MTPKQSDTCLVPQLVGGWGWKFCPLPDPGSLAGVRAQGLAALGLVPQLGGRRPGRPVPREG